MDNVNYTRYYISDNDQRIVAYGEWATDTFTVMDVNCKTLAVTTSLDAADAYVRLCYPSFKQIKTVTRKF